MTMASCPRRVGRAFLLSSALCVVAIASTVMAGSIFDDDYVPPPTQVAPSVTPPAKSDSPAVPAPPTPSPDAPSVPAPQTPAHETNPPTPAPTLLAVPASADQAHSRKLFKEAFADDLKDHSPTARRALATKLLTEADKVADNPCDRFVLLVGACDAATEAGDLPLADKAAETAATFYKVDSAHLAANASLKTPLKVSSPAQAAETLDEEMDIENRLALSGDYATAAKILSALQPLASRDPEAGPMVKERTKQLAEMRIAHDHAQTAEEKLKKAPDDPAANTAVGEFLCFVNGDFAHGLTALAHGDDPAIRQVAKKDLEGAADSNQQIAIGDGWWDLAEKKAIRDFYKPAIRKRAAFWYAKALAGGQVTGLSRTMLERRTAAATGEHESVYLSALKETKVDGIVVDGHWGLAKDAMNPGSTGKISVDSVRYDHALGFNPNGGNVVHIDYDLAGKYRRFTGAVGMNDSAGSFAATLTFKIFADGKELWRSQPIHQTKIAEKFNISVYNVKTLELQVDCNGPGHNAHCVWIEPKVEAR